MVLHIVTLCGVQLLYSNTVCDVQCVLVIGAAIIPFPVC